MVFISVNTPIKKKGIGAGQTSDLRWVESCARQICKNASGHTIVVEKSTLPVKKQLKLLKISLILPKLITLMNIETFQSCQILNF